MSIDLKSLSPRELQKLIAEANREQQRKKKRSPIAKVRGKLTRMAEAEGYSLAELFGIRSGAGTRNAAAAPGGTKQTRPPKRASTKGSKVPPKYRNPDNPSETWSGRGVNPRWMNEALAKGAKREDFLI